MYPNTYLGIKVLGSAYFNLTKTTYCESTESTTAAATNTNTISKYYISINVLVASTMNSEPCSRRKCI